MFPQPHDLCMPDIVVIFQREEKTETKHLQLCPARHSNPKVINQVPISLVYEQQSVSSPLAPIHHALL